MKYIFAIVLFVLFMICTLATESRSEMCVDLETSTSVIFREISPKIEEYIKIWSIDTDQQLFSDNVMKIIKEREKDVPLLHEVQINIFFLVNDDGKIVFILQTIFLLYDLNEIVDYEDSLNFVIIKNFILLVKEIDKDLSDNPKVGI